MSETVSFPPVAESVASTRRTPTVYFIDDSATMREVIKIAFRRENITVVTAGDAASAIAQFETTPPDAVITDVIMPDQDGYAVCSQIRQHPRFSKTPVILMSGVVNKGVADKAVSVGADELIRKPFQPQELISRVKSFLEPKLAQPSAPPPALVPHHAPPAPVQRPVSHASLSSLFAPAPQQPPSSPLGAHAHVEQRVESAWPNVLTDAFTPQPHSLPHANAPAPQSPNPFAPPLYPAQQQPPAPVRPQSGATDLQKLKTEISRLELLIKKLQTELQIERQYNQALELHVKSLTAID